MTNIVGRMREALRGDQRVDADALVARLDAIRRFLDAVDGQVPDARLVGAHTLVERAGTRLSLSRDHTVVALAGATGSGKSSLFNALAQMELSPVGVRRPTTGVAHACVWGPLDGRNRLLDWVGVLPRHRFVRESALDGDDESALHGLVLLDLPDFDSVQRSHRLEVDRLLGLVDLVVWVVDPQKYADRVIHNSYLREFHRHRDVTVVVLNQADRLPPAELPRVLADLRRLLDADGLDGVPLLATIGRRARPGSTSCAATLERAVAGSAGRAAPARRRRRRGGGGAGRAGRRRGPGGRPGRRDGPCRWTGRWPARPGCRRWPSAVEGAYRHRAAGSTGWPLVRGWRAAAPRPAAPAAPARPGDRRRTARQRLLAATSVPDPTAAQHSALGLAMRAVGRPGRRAACRRPGRPR